LNKSNRQLSSELEKTRRKCEVVQDKYQNMRNLVSKDKNIGVGRQEEPSFVKVEKKLEKQASNKQLLN
jgi:cobalamin biosynthesis protein CbiG